MAFLDPVFNPVLMPIVNLSPFWALVILALFISIIVTLVYKWTTNQAHMKELKDKQIVVITNLEPRKMKGIESQCMLLAAESEDHGKIILLSPEKKIDSGSKVQ